MSGHFNMTCYWYLKETDYFANNGQQLENMHVILNVHVRVWDANGM